MNWLHPTYLWTLAIAPLVAGLFIWAAWRRREAFRRFGDSALLARLSGAVSARRRRWKAAVVCVSALLLAIALAGPRHGAELREVKREGVDLVIALDVSLSMMAEDVAPNRLARSKNEVKKMLEGLRGDRVGLVIFAGDAFIQCPLTTDYGALRLFLDVAEPSMIPTPGTDFSGALKMAMQAFDSARDEGDQRGTRALLIVSDGENHVANLNELTAEADRAGIVIFAAGVGETAGVPIPLSRNGQRAGYKKDSAGRIVHTRLEEDALRAMAIDGGYFRVARTSSSLPQLTTALERLERTEFASEEFASYDEKYQWPLALALLLLAIERMIGIRRKRPALA